jgi:hypothetical protein
VRAHLLGRQGIRLVQSKSLTDRPSVASDGDGFLVVWDDLRNGRDWDVYGARVTGDGKTPDPDGFLVAGGEHNQCRATAAFCQGSYLVTFLSFEGQGTVGKGGSGYVLRSARVSPEGKVLDAAPAALSDTKMSLKVWNPMSVAGGNTVLVAAYNDGYGPDYKPVGISTAAIAMPDGKPVAPAANLDALLKGRTVICLGARKVHHPCGAAWTGRQFLVCVPSQKSGKSADCVAVSAVDGQGKGSGEPEYVVFAGERLNDGPCLSLAYDGERCLLTEDVILSAKAGKGETFLSQVHGGFLSPEGKPLDGGKTFAISGNAAGTHCFQGFAAAGAKGQFLAVWTEARGVNDVKIVARVVK